MDSSGNISTPGSVTAGAGGSVAGYSAYGAGTATTAPTASVGFMAPTSVTTKFMMKLPAAPISGLLYNTGTTDPSTITFVNPWDVAEVSLTDGSTITWTLVPGENQRTQCATVTLGGNRTLAFSGLARNMGGYLRVIQDGTGSRTLALPANSRVNGSTTTVTLLTAAAAENILAWFSPDGTAIRWTNGTF
jgi:hypothetical protein